MMAIQNPISDLARSVQHEQDRTWPHEVKLAVSWRDAKGNILDRSATISADQFFGMGNHGAPLHGAAIIGMIEQMLRAGPPKPERKGKKK